MPCFTVARMSLRDPSLLEVSQPSCSLWLCGHPCYGSKTTYGGRVCRTHGLRVHSITVGKPRPKGCAAKSGRERWVLVLSVLPPFSQSRTPVHAVVPPTFRVDLPASAQCRNPLAYLEVCLLGDFGHCRVDSINHHTVLRDNLRSQGHQGVLIYLEF